MKLVFLPPWADKNPESEDDGLREEGPAPVRPDQVVARALLTQESQNQLIMLKTGFFGGQ